MPSWSSPCWVPSSNPLGQGALLQTPSRCLLLPPSSCPPSPSLLGVILQLCTSCPTLSLPPNKSLLLRYSTTLVRGASPRENAPPSSLVRENLSYPLPSHWCLLLQGPPFLVPPILQELLLALTGTLAPVSLFLHVLSLAAPLPAMTGGIPRSVSA